MTLARQVRATFILTHPLAHTQTMTDSIIRLPELTRRIGLSKSAIYARIQLGTFPQPLPLGGKATGWLESEIQQWIDTLKAKRDAA